MTEEIEDIVKCPECKNKFTIVDGSDYPDESEEEEEE